MRIRTGWLAAAVCAALAGCATEAPPPPPAPTEVKVSTVLQRDVPIYVEAIGETRGATEIEIRARVEGFLQSVEFQEGSFVTKGQLLYRIDPSPFQATQALGGGWIPPDGTQESAAEAAAAADPNSDPNSAPMP